LLDKHIIERRRARVETLGEKLVKKNSNSHCGSRSS
jgi:hypothetical protein